MHEPRGHHSHGSARTAYLYALSVRFYRPATMSTVNAVASTVNLAGRDINNIYMANASITDILEKFAIVTAAYNSSERYSEHASICAEGTRDAILTKIRQWAHRNDNYRMCWVSGKAGTGKSTIAHTIAKECDEEKRLGFSFFFSHRNRDRSDITKFIPTFAYQLATFFPSVQDSIKMAVAMNPGIFHQSPKDQLAKLVVNPFLSIVDSLSTMTIVVDGLDEYDGEVPLEELVSLFRDLPDRLPFRILFASRPEARIQEIFNSPSVTRQTYCLELQDFPSQDEVRALLHSRLLTVRDKRNLPSTWPSTADLDQLSKQSDGLYIYAETVIRFIDDEYASPTERLQSALKAYSGIDHLYDQVLLEARRYPSFSRVMGSIIHLADPLNISALGKLLQLPSHAIRLALRGSFSILVIPDDDDDYIRPYHASLQDFFVDRDRSKDHYLDPLEHNQSIMDDCIKLLHGSLLHGTAGREASHYACRYWYHHLGLVVSSASGIDHVRSDIQTRMIEFMKDVRSRLLKNWMIALGRSRAVEDMRKDLRIVVTRFPSRAMLELWNACLAKSTVLSELQKVLKKVDKFIDTFETNFGDEGRHEGRHEGRRRGYTYGEEGYTRYTWEDVCKEVVSSM